MFDRLRALAERQPDRTAIANAEAEMSFSALVARAEALASLLSPRTVIACVLPSGPEFTATHLAALHASATFVPLPKSSTPAELRRAFALVPPDVIVVARDGAEATLEAAAPYRSRYLDAEQSDWGELEVAATSRAETTASWAPAREWLPDEAAMVQFTSGSTGAPKGVLLSRSNIEADLAQGADFFERFGGTAIFSPMPQFHAMGGAVVLEHLLHGATVLVANRFVPGDDKRRMEQAEVGLLVGSPSYFRMLLRLRLLAKLDSLRAVSLGSAASDAALLEGLGKQRPDVSVHLRYGLSETFGVVSRLDLEAGAPPPPLGLVGPALPGVELGPLPPVGTEDVAEVCVRAPTVALGRVLRHGEWGRLTGEDDFLRTGDMGQRDESGLHLRGRRSQFLKRNGHRIDPGEIEQALVAHPEVADAAVVGVPDPLAGSRIVAMIEGDVDAEALGTHCRNLLSDHKVPQRFVAVGSLPRTPSGKPDRTRVREAIMKGSKR